MLVLEPQIAYHVIHLRNTFTIVNVLTPALMAHIQMELIVLHALLHVLLALCSQVIAHLVQVPTI